MFTVSDDLVVYGGDKSGLAVCAMAGTDWKWAAPAITGDTTSPPALSFLHIRLAQVVVFVQVPHDCLRCYYYCSQSACLHHSFHPITSACVRSCMPSVT